jgi:predicted glycosyltransferase
MKLGLDMTSMDHTPPFVRESHKLRIALYSHDTVGMGHMRRNLLIARTLIDAHSDAAVLVIAGAREASAFAMPCGVDCLTLPSLAKNATGDYQSRYLGLPLNEMVSLRAKTIQAALDSFDPNVLIVDKVPRGAGCELDRALKSLRSRGHARCVLGLRDILDDAHTVQGEWQQAQNAQAVRDFYDAIWVYGDPACYNTIEEYQFPCDLAAMTQYTGFFDSRARLCTAVINADEALSTLGLPPGRLVMCVLGGGEDGGRLAEAFSNAVLPPNTNAIILTGSLMPTDLQRRLHDRMAGRPRWRVLAFHPEPEVLLSRADRVISMGGYNTVSEILSFQKRALIVPRVEPRLEQFIRADRLQKLGLIDMLHPREVTPHKLSTWLARDLGPPPAARTIIDFRGLERLPGLLDQLLVVPADRAQHLSS